MFHSRLSLALVCAVLSLGIASTALAADKIWSVPGVVNNGLATVFSCSNGNTTAATVSVALFSKNGNPAFGSGSASIPAGGETNFVTKAVAALPGGNDVDMGAGLIVSGSARITAPSGVYCAAFLIDAFTDPPASMMALPVIKKTTQKGV